LNIIFSAAFFIVPSNQFGVYLFTNKWRVVALAHFTSLSNKAQYLAVNLIAFIGCTTSILFLAITEAHCSSWVSSTHNQANVFI